MSDQGLASNDTYESPPPLIEHVNVRVSDGDKEVFFKLSKSTSLGKVMRAFCERQGKNKNSVNFLLDGTRINDDDTPDTLDLQDGYTLEVHQAHDGSAAENQPPLLSATEHDEGPPINPNIIALQHEHCQHFDRAEKLETKKYDLEVSYAAAQAENGELKEHVEWVKKVNNALHNRVTLLGGKNSDLESGIYKSVSLEIENMVLQERVIELEQEKNLIKGEQINLQKKCDTYWKTNNDVMLRYEKLEESLQETRTKYSGLTASSVILHVENEKLKKGLQELGTSNAALQAKEVELQEVINNLNHSSAASEAQVKVTEQEKGDLRDQLIAVQASSAAFQIENQALVLKIIKLQGENAKMYGENVTLRIGLKRVKEGSVDLGNGMRAMERDQTRVAENETLLFATNRDLQDRLKDVSRDNENLKHSVSDTEQDLRKVTEEKEVLQRQLSALKFSKSSLKGEKQALRQTLSDLEDELLALTDALDAQDEECDTIATCNDDLKSEVQRLVAPNIALGNDIDVRLTDNETLKQENEALIKDKRDLTANLRALEILVGTLQVKVVDYQKPENNLTTKSTVAERRTDGLDQDDDNLAKGVSELNTTVEKLAKENTERKAVETLENEAKMLHAGKATMQSEIEKLSKTMAPSQAENDKTKEGSKAKRIDATSLQADHESREDELASLQSKDNGLDVCLETSHAESKPRQVSVEAESVKREEEERAEEAASMTQENVKLTCGLKTMEDDKIILVSTDEQHSADGDELVDDGEKDAVGEDAAIAAIADEEVDVVESEEAEDWEVL